MSRAVDPGGAFRGEGEDMIAALIEASKVRPVSGTRGDGSATFDVDGEVVRGKRSFERELVPFDFGGEARETSGGGVLRNIPAPKTPGSPAPMAIPAPKTPGETGRKKKEANKGAAIANANDPRVRANQVCEPQKPTISAEQQQAVLAAQSDKKKGKSGKMDPAKHQVWTSGERYAQSSFQNAPSADQLPMPSFLREMAPVEPEPAPNTNTMRPVSAPPTSANDLKSLLGMKPATPPPALFAPPAAPKGHALFNSILSSATNKEPVPQMPVPQMPPAQMPPHTLLPPHMMPAQPYGAPPQGAPPVQHKLNAIFGVPSQPPQPFPVPPAYPTAPETAGGNFQTLMSKLNAGRV